MVICYILWSCLWPFSIFCGDLVYFVVIWYILWSFVIFCGHVCGHLVYFVVIWYIFVVIWYNFVNLCVPTCPRFGILHQ
jgi:hypothetical protein